MWLTLLLVVIGMYVVISNKSEEIEVENAEEMISLVEEEKTEPFVFSNTPSLFAKKSIEKSVSTSPAQISVENYTPRAQSVSQLIATDQKSPYPVHSSLRGLSTLAPKI